MVIKPEHEPRLFLKIFGEHDASKVHPETAYTQRERARAWDAAIEFIMLRQPIQQPVLTHQPKGD